MYLMSRALRYSFFFSFANVFLPLIIVVVFVVVVVVVVWDFLSYSSLHMT